MSDQRITAAAQAIMTERFLRNLPAYMRAKIQSISLNTTPDKECMDDARAVLAAVASYDAQINAMIAGSKF